MSGTVTVIGVDGVTAEDRPLRLGVPGDTKSGRDVGGVESSEIIPVTSLGHDRRVPPALVR